MKLLTATFIGLLLLQPGIVFAKSNKKSGAHCGTKECGCSEASCKGSKCKMKHHAKADTGAADKDLSGKDEAKKDGATNIPDEET